MNRFKKETFLTPRLASARVIRLVVELLLVEASLVLTDTKAQLTKVIIRTKKIVLNLNR
jgi:hypothetical protein